MLPNKPVVRLVKKAYLVKVGAEEVHLGGVLQQSWPVFLLELLLSQHHLDVGWRMMRLGVLHVDLAVELQFKVIRCLLGV